MDPLTHGLAGAVLAQAGFRQRYGYQATLALTGGALLPDMDIVWSPVKSVAALESHRGITHSLVGALGLALVLGLVLRILGRETRWMHLSALSLLGILVGHLFLDLITTYGIQLLLPFSRTRPALDLVFILDPIVTVPLLAALIGGILWRHSTAVIARLSLGLVVAYLGFMTFNHVAAVAAMERSVAGHGVSPVRVEALPGPLNPLRWQGLAESGGTYWTGDVQLWGGAVALTAVPKGPDNPLVAAARVHPDVQIFLWFARFPVVSFLEDGGQYVVEYRDLRFAHSLRNRTPFVLRVILSPAGEVVETLFTP
ncbi:MAG: metal-dependent hydrolase [Candidatus Methylomirabilia bacterium]